MESFWKDCPEDEFDFETPGDKRENLYQEILVSKGWSIAENISALRLSYYIFKKNWKELQILMEDKLQNGIISSGFRSSEEVREHQKEVLRCLHNYTSAIKTLVDHTRVLIKKMYSGTKFGEKCTLIGKEIGLDPVARFLQDLRNYIVHRKIPECVACTSTTRRVFLPVNTLLDWDGWSKEARNYLEQYDIEDAIDISIVINEYAEIIRNFYVWLALRQREIHKEEFSVVSEKMEDLRGMYRGTGIHIFDLEDFLLDSEI